MYEDNKKNLAQESYFKNVGLSLILVHIFDPTDKETEAGVSQRVCGHLGK